MTLVLEVVLPYLAACAAAAALGWGFGALVGRWGALVVAVAVGVVLATASEALFGPPAPSGDDAAKLHGLGLLLLAGLLAPAAAGVFAGVWWRKACAVAADEHRSPPAPPRTVGWPRPDDA